MSRAPSDLAAPASADVERPFSEDTRLTPLGDGRYAAELGPRFTVGRRAHGGLLMVLMTRAALQRLDTEKDLHPRRDGPEPPSEPIAVSAEFLRAPELGPVELTTEVLKLGRQASVLDVRMAQEGRTILAATVTGGRLPDEEPEWAAVAELPAVPPPDSLDPAAFGASKAQGVALACETRYDRATFAFVRGETAEPVVRLWTRPHGEDPDPLFALFAGDLNPPVVFNLGGRPAWAPTVQLTALLRARPAPGWLRIEARATTVAGAWFDSDAVVVDSAGRIVCQSRQIALRGR